MKLSVVVKQLLPLATSVHMAHMGSSQLALTKPTQPGVVEHSLAPSKTVLHVVFGRWQCSGQWLPTGAFPNRKLSHDETTGMPQKINPYHANINI